MNRTPVDNLTARRLGLRENMTAGEMEQAQLRALRATLDHAVRHSPFYREYLAHLGPGIPESLSDLRKLPFLTREDIITQGNRLLSVSQSRVARIITMQTSGSTGLPKRFSFTAEDLASTSDFFLHGMYSLIDGDDRVLVLLPYLQPASVGELLIAALAGDGIYAEGLWPPESSLMAEKIRAGRFTCVVGLPQHLLAVSAVVPWGQLKSMLLCSDYASPALRWRIEENCGCETFLHYGATESGLGGAVECFAHDGCHLRGSDLLVEIVDPETGHQLADGESGEVVLTTLDREAMPLIRYRTGDIAILDRSRCICGGVTARLKAIRGRLEGCRLASGMVLYSQDIDDYLFQVPGLLDYRLRLDTMDVDRLHLDFQAVPKSRRLAKDLVRTIRQIPAIRDSLADGSLVLGDVQQVECFSAIHTIKRTILDQRTKGEAHAACS